jgi:hypothetical protein
MPTEYRTGELLILEDGEYSDKSWSGPFRVLKDFDIIELAEQLKATWKTGPNDYGSGPGPFDFRDWLHKEGFIADVECRSVHIGSYGTLEIER